MTAVSPIVPLFGMSNTLFLGMAVLVGFAFGFFLERAGFGSAKNLTSIFILRDFRVFRVMFSAVITAMLGSQLLSAVGVLDLSLVSFDPTYFWAMLAGGLVFGVGFYVGGFCPGTAAVALARGRWDGAAFLFGIVLGIYAFALLFDAVGQSSWFADFYAPADAERMTLYGDGPVWPWILGLTAVALVAFKVVPVIERRYALRTVEQLEAIEAGEPVPPNTPPRITGRLLKVGPVLAFAVVGAVLLLELVLPDGVPHVQAASSVPVTVEVDDEHMHTVDPLTLVSWLVAEEHRRLDDQPPRFFVVDVRSAGERAQLPIPGTLVVDIDGDSDRARLARALEVLGETMSRMDRNKPVVVFDGANQNATMALVDGLRRRGINAMALEGGAEAWQRQVLDPDAVWPGWQRRDDVLAQTHPSAEMTSGDSEVAPRPDLNVADVQRSVRQWLAGESDDLPPQFAIPGTVLLPAKPATVQPTGGGGGGCG